MKLTTFSIIWALIHIAFALGLLLVPVMFMSQFGVTLDNNGTLPAQILGGAFTGLALIYYWNRNFSATDAAQHNILLASFIFHVVSLPVVVMATLNGPMNAMGWMPVSLHIFLAATFGYFSFSKSAKPATPPVVSIP
jgi:hypothetical protein